MAKESGHQLVLLATLLMALLLGACATPVQALPPASGQARSTAIEPTHVDSGATGQTDTSAARVSWDPPDSTRERASLDLQPAGPLATVQVDPITLSPGETRRTPIWVRNVTAPSGLGAYHVELTFDPGVINLISVEGGDAPFESSPVWETPVWNIDNTRGWAAFVHFQPSIPGPTGDLLVAYLTIKVVGPSGPSTTLDISITNLVDSNGDDIPATDSDGSVVIR